jgi:hypothetical protein
VRRMTVSGEDDGRLPQVPAPGSEIMSAYNAQNLPRPDPGDGFQLSEWALMTGMDGNEPYFYAFVFKHAVLPPHGRSAVVFLTLTRRSFAVADMGGDWLDGLVRLKVTAARAACEEKIKAANTPVAKNALSYASPNDTCSFHVGGRAIEAGWSQERDEIDGIAWIIERLERRQKIDGGRHYSVAYETAIEHLNAAAAALDDKAAADRNGVDTLLLKREVSALRRRVGEVQKICLEQQYGAARSVVMRILSLLESTLDVDRDARMLAQKEG